MGHKITKVLAVVAVIFLVLIAIWIPLRNSWYSCDARYNDEQLYFSGGYRGVNTVEFFRLSCYGFPKPSLGVHIGDDILRTNEISLETMEAIGAKRDSVPFANDWVIHWPSVENSEYVLRFEFEDRVFKGVDLVDEPNVNSENCPFAISLDGKEKITLPITLRELDDIVGKPDLLHRSIRFP